VRMRIFDPVGDELFMRNPRTIVQAPNADGWLVYESDSLRDGTQFWHQIQWVSDPAMVSGFSPQRFQERI
jgi:hypothetical protein